MEIVGALYNKEYDLNFAIYRRKYMYTDNRSTEVAMLKKLWLGEEVVCPKCREDILVHLHKKAKKSDCDWKCPKCGEIYRTMHMLKQLPDQ